MGEGHLLVLELQPEGRHLISHTFWGPVETEYSTIEMQYTENSIHIDKYTHRVFLYLYNDDSSRPVTICVMISLVNSVTNKTETIL